MQWSCRHAQRLVSAQSSTQRPNDGDSHQTSGVHSIDDLALVELFGDHLVIVVSTRVQFETSFAELGATPMRCGDQFQPCMSGSSLFQGARQVPDGFWSQRAVHTGWGSSVAFSCWFRTVAEARDENRDKRQGCGAACVPPLKSNRNVGKATWFSGSSVRPFPGACLLVSWLCGRPWPSVPVLCVGLVPSCAPGLVALSGFVLRVSTQGTDPRTDLQAGIPKYVRFTWTWDWLLGIYSYIFPIVSSCASFFALQGGVCGRASTCRAGSPWRLLLFTFLSFFLSAGSAWKKTWLKVRQWVVQEAFAPIVWWL